MTVQHNQTSKHQQDRTGKTQTHIVTGILAHVDAGKTTLSEAILFETGKIRKFGRVDHADTYLDTTDLERKRGITMLAHQTQCSFHNLNMTLLDTPGHVDFGAETERVISVLDYALLVVSATDGVQSHTQTLWQLLRKHHIPTIIVINKIDAAGVDIQAVYQDIRQHLSDNCVLMDEVPMGDAILDGTIHQDSTASAAVPTEAEHGLSEIDSAGNVRGKLVDEIALCDELALQEALDTGAISASTISRLIADEELFACIPVAALKQINIRALLMRLSQWCIEPQYGEDFGAKVFKISHDPQHARLTWLKVTGGALLAKALVTGTYHAQHHQQHSQSESHTSLTKQHAYEEYWEEKVDQVRVYDADSFTIAPSIPAGYVCAVTGLQWTTPGMGLGAEADDMDPQLQPVLNYAVIPASSDGVEYTSDGDIENDAAESGSAPQESGLNETEHKENSSKPLSVLASSHDRLAQLPEFDELTLHRCLTALYECEDEDPLLHVQWVSEIGQIHIQCMGAIQQEVLVSRLHDQFGLDVQCVPAGIIYKESVTAAIEGVGHFEPLRHYAEVHVLIEPNTPGAGVTYSSQCDPNTLSINWRKLIMTHLQEREHKGVLIGAPITDVKLTLLAGRGHEKHTEGGDFRQATYRAVRQGLMRARQQGMCVLLEPWYRFTLEVPTAYVGRALSDIQRMHGVLEAPEMTDYGTALIQGTCPVATMHEYATEVAAYSHGSGRLSCVVSGYQPCHNADAVINEYQYQPVADLEHTPDSVFCAHGAGYPVAWDKVPDHMHIDWMYT